MGHAIGAVLEVREVEALDDLFHAHGSVNRQRFGVCAAHPTHHCHLTQTVDMVGVEVGQENRAYIAKGEAHPGQVTDTTRAGIHHKQFIVGGNGHTSTCPLRVRHGAPSSAQNNVQAIPEFLETIPRHGGFDRNGRDTQRNRRALLVRQQHKRQQKKNNNEFFHKLIFGWCLKNSTAHQNRGKSNHSPEVSSKPWEVHGLNSTVHFIDAKPIDPKAN